MDFLYWMGKAVKGMFQSVPAAPGELQISEKMANAITGWLLAFYQRPAWLEAGYRVTNAPINVTDYMSTLACNEIAMSAGASARGTWINDQLTRFLLPQLKNAVQLAGAGGRVVVKPYPSGRNIYCEIIPADRIYPTRINGAGVTEAGFFTDFAALRGRKVVRVEAGDLQPYGLYLQNRAYWYNAGDTLGGVVQVVARNVPAGLGEPCFDKLDARLAYALMGVGAVKAVEVGEGFAAARLTGSQNNDPMLPGGCFASNHAGGILGGISSGQDIVLRVGVKPIASIAQEQQTIDVHDQPASVLIGGRHDLAAIPRIVPVLTAMTALVLADALLLQERMAVLPVPDGVDWF